METISISKFSANCSAVLERVRRTKKPVLITRFGKPVAQVVPSPPALKTTEWIGSLKGTGRIVGDIVSPAGETDWQALRR